MKVFNSLEGKKEEGNKELLTIFLLRLVVLPPLRGSSTLTPVLLEQGLVDEVLLLVYPVLLGRGKRFFSDSVDARELALVSTKAASSGVLMNTYRPVGSLRTESFADASG